MLTGKSGQLVSWALEGREQTLQVPLCLWGELWGNGQWAMGTMECYSEEHPNG